MPSILPFQIITLLADLAFFVFVVYYFLQFRAKEKEIESKSGKVDTDYHQIVDTALTKERKILDDATVEADHIIAGAKYVSDDSVKRINTALEKMIADIQKEAVDTSRTFMHDYSTTLQQLTKTSLTDFQHILQGLQTDMQKQITEFHEKQLPMLEKELETYKQSRMKEADQLISRVVQKTSQEVLNKSISLDDHQDLVVASLEKAKKEGVFE